MDITPRKSLLTNAVLSGSVITIIALLAACTSPSLPAGRPPHATETWQYQLTGTIDTSVDAEIYDIDLFTTPTSVIDELHRAGRTVICYTSLGSLESRRPDASSVPQEIIGNELEDWPGEYWLDVRRLDRLEPFIAARLDLCKQKGFDGVEPDNVDGFNNDSGFPLTAEDQLAFNRKIAEMARARSLTVGLKNNLDQVDELIGDFDFAVNEECVQYRECDRLTPFVDAGKPVLHVEYELTTAQFCAQTTELGFRSIRKSIKLDAPVEPCPVAFPSG